jgi:hypothetical protein
MLSYWGSYSAMATTATDIIEDQYNKEQYIELVNKRE